MSLFERMQAAGVEPNMLQLQYRMHPSICAFPSLKFYDGRLASQPTAADRMPPKGDFHVSTRREYGLTNIRCGTAMKIKSPKVWHARQKLVLERCKNPKPLGTIVDRAAI